MQTLFVSWQDQISRQFFVIGELYQNEENYYCFRYTQGVEKALERGFRFLPNFNDPHTIVKSEKLFPIFANRLLPKSRPEYQDVLSWSGLNNVNETSALTLLGRSITKRETDHIELFSKPILQEDGYYETYFFIHGLSHASNESKERIYELKKGERLNLLSDFQNKYDPKAFSLRTDETKVGDMFLMGYLPRFLTDYTYHLMSQQCEVEVSVEQVNVEVDVPFQYKILAKHRSKCNQDLFVFDKGDFVAFHD